jgi:excisionase family DNA binding protein
MIKMLPKKLLDMDLLEELAKYYRINKKSEIWKPDDLLEWECFSDPSLQVHECNNRAPLRGGFKCNYCKNIPNRVCKDSCDFRTFCLAVFAWRLGIGDQDLKEALKHNLYVLTEKELYNAVIKKLANEDIVSENVLEDLNNIVDEPEDIVQEVVKESVPNACVCVETEEIEPVLPEVVEENKEDLLSISAAAEYYGCTYANIYNYIKSGRLKHVMDNNVVKVRKSDLDEFSKTIVRKNRKE